MSNFLGQVALLRQSDLAKSAVALGSAPQLITTPDSNSIGIAIEPIALPAMAGPIAAHFRDLLVVKTHATNRRDPFHALRVNEGYQYENHTR